METPTQTCSRLVTALEDLAEQESASLRARDFAAVREIQKRAAPLVEHLTLHGPRVADANLKKRIGAIIKIRDQSEAWLSAEIEKTRQEICSVETRQRRASQVAPAYGHALARKSRFRGIG